jgi:CRISPR-associated endonuclease/helicase Cas3
LGSLIELDKQPDGDSDLLPEMQDLALHMVAAHHGRGRPWFPEYEIYDPENSDQQARETALRVAGRYSRMQQIHGRWGLAYLESLLRATDILASQPELEVPQ